MSSAGREDARLRLWVCIVEAGRGGDVGTGQVGSFLGG